MSQPQNPQNDPLLARIDKNPTGADLIQVLNTAGGSGVIWRLNQFQVPWYAGFGSPTVIPGQLATDLYMDLSTGDMWYFNGNTWIELPSGGGGGGTSVETLSTTLGTITGTFNSVNTTFTLNTAPTLPGDVLLFLNGIYQVQGTDYTISGNTVNLTIPPSIGGELVAVINVSTEGFVLTLSSITGGITGTFNGLNVTFTMTTTPTETANTALFLNGIYQVQGTDYTIAINIITMTIAPILGDQLVAVINTNGGGGGGGGVTSLNTLTGDVTLAAGANVTLTPSGNTITIASTGGGGGGGVTSVNGETGAIDITAGAGISITPSGSNIEVTNTGITSLNSETGDVDLLPGTGIAITPSGDDILISSTGIANVPWLDIQNYGGVPKTSVIANESTSCTLNGTTVVTLGAAKNFVNGEGVVFYAAGPATGQGTPAAPTMTCPAVSGSGPSTSQQTITYQIVGFDALGGLTAASDINMTDGQISTAPAVFGNPAVNISSIAQVSGTVTVNFSAPLGNTVAAGMTLHITGMGLIPGNLIPGDKIFNGVWTIASAPTTSQVTFALAGNYGSGTVGSGPTLGTTQGRVSNVAVISAISRSSAGVVTVTTVEPHNFTTQSGNNPTVVIIENVTPLSFFGYWVIASTPTANTFTINTANLTAETGVVGVNGTSTTAGTATCYEFITLACPPVQNNSPTIGYFVYSDSPSPGNGLKLIGKTLGTESHFTDWGPSLMAGFVAPAYVPTTPPVAAQNQLFSTHIVSGAGTTTLVVAAAPPTSIAALGGTIVHDDSWAWKAATAARTQGAILISPPANGSSGYFYVCNYPQTYPAHQNHIVACGLIINETQTFGGTCGFSSEYGATTTINPQFSNRNYSEVIGIGSPAIYTGTGFFLNGIGFLATANGVNAVMINGDYATVSNCSFDAQSFGTSVPLIFNGNGSGSQMIDCSYVAQSLWGDVSAVGQSCLTPLIPNVWLRASDNTVLAGGTVAASFYMRGNHTLNGRGFLVDQKYRTTGALSGYAFGEFLWNQAATNPTVAFWGQLATNVTINNVLNDSTFVPVLFNGNTQGMINVTCLNSLTAGTPPCITGNPIVQLFMQGNSGQYQNTNSIIQAETTALNLGGSGSPPAGSLTHQNQPISLGASSTMFCPVTVAAPSSVTASGSGSFTGTFSVTLAYIGFDGAVTNQGPAVSVTASAQQIVVNWTLPAGFAGVMIGISGLAQNNANSPFTGTSHTFSSIGNQGNMPADDATGLPCFSPKNGGTIVSPNYLVAGSSIFDVAITAPTLTANRAQTHPDASGIIALSWVNTNVTPLTVNTSTTVDQNLMSVTIPAGTLNVVGRTLHLHLAGVYSTPICGSAITLTFKVKLGTLTLIDIVTSAADFGGGVTNNKWLMDSWITTQTAGISSAFEASGQLLIDLGALNSSADTIFPDTNTSTIGTLDTTANQVLQITVAFSQNSSSNSCTQRQMILNTIN